MKSLSEIVMKPLKESILASSVAESILDGGPDRSLDNVVIFEKAKKWLDRYADTVRGLKINDDGTLDADAIALRDRLDVKKLPDYIKFNYVEEFVVNGCQQWKGLSGSYPRRCDGMYLRDIAMKDLSGFGDSEIEWLVLSECHKLERNLKIPNNHNIKAVRIIHNRWGEYDEDHKKQFKRAHIEVVP